MSEISKLNGYDIKDKKSIRTYDNISTMKQDESLKEGQHIKTRGYYEINDGGSAEYIIVNDDSLVADDGFIHDLTNGLKAQLIFNESINLKQFGAVGDGITDDTLVISNLLSSDSIQIDGLSLQYKISSGLTISNPITLKNIEFIADFNPSEDGNPILDITGENIILENIMIDGENYNHTAIILDGCKYITIKDSFITNCYYTAIYCENSPKFVTINNVKVDNCTHTYLGGAFQICENAEHFTIENCEVSNIVGKGFVAIDCKYIDFINCKAINCVYENFSPRRNAIHITFKNCYSYKDNTSDLTDPTNSSITPLSNSGVKCSRGAKFVTFKDCDFIQNGGSGVVSAFHNQGCSNVIVDNCNIEATTDQCVLISWHVADGELYPATPANNLVFKDCIIKSTKTDGGIGLFAVPTYGDDLDNIEINNCIFEGYTQAIRFTLIKNSRIINNIFKPSEYQTTCVILMTGNSNDNIEHAKDIKIDNNIFENLIVPAFNISYYKNINIANNILKGNLNTVFLSNLATVSNINIISNIFEGTFNTCISIDANTTEINVNSNIFNGGGVGTAIRQNGTNAIISSNNFNVATPLNPVNGGNSGSVSGNNYMKRTIGTDIPTTGTWKKGDIIFNMSPDPGEFVGWVCVSAGTPGTWKGFGAIDNS